jgi:hypothetical protein
MGELSEAKQQLVTDGTAMERVFLKAHPPAEVRQLLKVGSNIPPSEFPEEGAWAFRTVDLRSAGGLGGQVLEIINPGHIVKVSVPPEDLTPAEVKAIKEEEIEFRKIPTSIENQVHRYKPPRVLRRTVGHVYGPKRGRLCLEPLEYFNNEGWKLLSQESSELLKANGITILMFDLPKDRNSPYTPLDWGQGMENLKYNLDNALEQGNKGYPKTALAAINLATQRATRTEERSRVLLDAGVYNPETYGYILENTRALDAEVWKLREHLLRQDFWTDMIEKVPLVGEIWGKEIGRMLTKTNEWVEATIEFGEAIQETGSVIIKHIMGLERNYLVILQTYTSIKNTLKEAGVPIPIAMESAMDEAVTFINFCTDFKYQVRNKLKAWGQSYVDAFDTVISSLAKGGTGELGALGGGLIAGLVTAIIGLVGVIVAFMLYPELLTASAENAENRLKAIDSAREHEHTKGLWVKNMLSEIFEAHAKAGLISAATRTKAEQAEKHLKQAEYDFKGMVSALHGALTPEKKKELYSALMEKTRAMIIRQANILEGEGFKEPISSMEVTLINAQNEPAKTYGGGTTGKKSALMEGEEASPWLYAIPAAALIGLGYFYLRGDK